jgi:hypothetical protein
LLAVVLSYRQFVRVFVLSIGEACREATTAPVSGGAWWRSAGKRCQVECETTHWRPAGLAVVCRSGPRVAVSKASVVQCSVTIAGKRCQVEGEAAHWRPIGLAVACGQGLGLRSARRASCSAWWRSTGKRCQVEDEAAHWQPVGLAVAWSGCRVAGKPRLPWSGQCWRCSMAIGRQAVLGQRRDNALAADRACRAWSGCRVAGRGAQLPAVRPGLRSLD